MSPADYEAVGRGAVRLLIGVFFLAVVAGSLWVLGDLEQTYRRGEVDDVADWTILAWAAFLAITTAGSGAYGMLRLLTRRFDGLDRPPAL